MTLDKQAKVVRPSGKHPRDQLSIFDFHELRSPAVSLFHVASHLYSSTCRKFHVSSILGDERFRRQFRHQIEDGVIVLGDVGSSLDVRDRGERILCRWWRGGSWKEMACHRERILP
jgi:hypothetical protein